MKSVFKKLFNKSKGGKAMKKVLYIKANPKAASDSYTFKMSEEFIREYKKNNPNHEVIEVDLYERNVGHLDSEKLGQMFSGEDSVLKEYATEFKEADKYIFAAPMWNLSIPSILKAYIDHIAYAGISFQYTENGPVGLLKDKKAIHITSRGGAYSQGPAASFEMGDRYLRTILGFLGIEDVETVNMELTNVLGQEEVAEELESKKQHLKQLAKKF
jgi:FMN-dependent NADH-azoreductase